MRTTLEDGLTGSAWGDWANYTASPLRAFENELGVQAPVGFWDPVGFTSDGDVASFKRRRSVELKHGRISMMATMGVLIASKAIGFPYCSTMSCCRVDSLDALDHYMSLLITSHYCMHVHIIR